MGAAYVGDFSPRDAPGNVATVSRPRDEYVCLCCGEKGLDEAPDGMTYGICSNCAWEDDTTDPDLPSGANAGVTMREWRGGRR
jgi:hypothetical protein